MNERIKKLWEQSRYPSGRGHDEQKFAELIVKDCSSILRKEADSNWEGREERLLNAMADWIENHFGVKE